MLVNGTYFLCKSLRLSIVSKSESMIRGCVPRKLLNCMVKFSISCYILRESFSVYFFFAQRSTMNWRASLM